MLQDCEQSIPLRLHADFSLDGIQKRPIRFYQKQDYGFSLEEIQSIITRLWQIFRSA